MFVALVGKVQKSCKYSMRMNERMEKPLLLSNTFYRNLCFHILVVVCGNILLGLGMKFIGLLFMLSVCSSGTGTILIISFAGDYF